MNYYLLFILYLSISIVKISSYDLSQLKLLLLIHRHGDRTPISTYPKDPFRNASNWLDGWGQLTNKGKDRMFKLGEYVRKRYKDFLGSTPREVHVRSSAADRCLESTSLLLSGVYPPEGRWQWNADLGKNWQPFPIQTEPRPVDGMLNTGSKCAAAEEEVERIRKSQPVVEYTNQRKGILKYVSDNTGLNITDIIRAEEVFDTLLIEKENDYLLPRWVDDSTYKSLSDISDMTFYFDYSTKLVQRLRTGLLLEDMAKHMKEAIIPHKNIPNSETDATFHKFHIYSTHDTQLAVILNALNVFNMRSPPFGSVIFIELYEINKDHIIQLHYLNETESEKPFQLHLPNCVNHNNECHLGQFLHSIEQLIPINWKHECRNDEDSVNSGTVIISYLIGSLITFALMALLCLSCVYFRRKEDSIVYQMLPIG